MGVLDSGVGGLSVLREIHRLLPGVPTFYFADQAHIPYGPRSADEIRGYVESIADFLIGQGAAVIVMACHSASAASLTDLRARNPHIPIVGMEPAVKPAAEATRSGVIGVLTTQATANGALYKRVVARFAANVRVITQVAPELV
ncbi:MAG: aspartate/glutamate racemase family protein, partial [Anaerolineae bacterium]|nr:aspartate/glutamate racemase family protein [Anaerolineae bacterium]